MLLIITDTQDQIVVCDTFNDAFLFEVLAMYLEESGVYGTALEDILDAVESGLLRTFSTDMYTFTLIGA